MDVGQWNEATEQAEQYLAEMLADARACAEAADGQELRIEQRVTVELGGVGHAKWSRKSEAMIFELTPEEQAELDAEFGES